MLMNFLQVLLADGTPVWSSIVLSNATPYKTFKVRYLPGWFVLNIYMDSCYTMKHWKRISTSNFLTFCYMDFSVDNIFPYLKQELTPNEVLPNDFIRTINYSDYSSVRYLQNCFFLYSFLYNLLNPLSTHFICQSPGRGSL